MRVGVMETSTCPGAGGQRRSRDSASADKRSTVWEVGERGFPELATRRPRRRARGGLEVTLSMVAGTPILDLNIVSDPFGERGSI